MTLNMLIGILEQGLIYGIMAMGLLITYRILDFPDLTVDSSFPLGAADHTTPCSSPRWAARRAASPG